MKEHIRIHLSRLAIEWQGDR